MKPKPTAADKAANATAITNRRKQVAGYHLARWSQQEIAAKLEVSEATVSRDLAELRKAWQAEATTEVGQAIARELASLDQDEANWRAKQQKADKADFKTQLAIYDRILKIMERRARLLGLDAPTKQDVTSGGKVLDFAALMQAATHAPE